MREELPMLVAHWERTYGEGTRSESRTTSTIAACLGNDDSFVEAKDYFLHHESVLESETGKMTGIIRSKEDLLQLRMLRQHRIEETKRFLESKGLAEEERARYMEKLKRWKEAEKRLGKHLEVVTEGMSMERSKVVLTIIFKRIINYALSFPKMTVCATKRRRLSSSALK